jgi:ABC-2 type transport system ATP-binding protein
MSLTAEELVVIGRGSLIAETSVKDFVARSKGAMVKVVTPVAADFASALSRSGATVTAGQDGEIQVEGMTPAEIGDLAYRDRLVVHELTPVMASLEDAFMELTQDVVDYRSPALTASAQGGPR